MWARRCGAPPGSASLVKVLLQSFMTGAVGLAVYQYMSGADPGYLDLTNPLSEQVMCLSDWPLRHAMATWSEQKGWRDWLTYRINMTQFVEENKCMSSRTMTGNTCAGVDVPLSQMGRSLGIPLGKSYFWGNDAIEVYGYLFLWLTVVLWVMVTVHDVALLTVSNRDFVLDLQGVRSHFPCWRILWLIMGIRCWKRLARGRGILFVTRRFLEGRLSRILAIVSAPIFIAWGIVAFHVLVLPVVTVFFVIFPIRLSRVLIFLNSIVSGFLGVVLTVHCIFFCADVKYRQSYAVTWQVTDGTNSCICGCMYPMSFGRCVVLLLIGVVAAYKAFVLAFRCLKGLRRSSWANLMSVLFPIPLTVYEVSWTQPDGLPIQHRKEGEPVQGELAFDPFALMDEQPESGRTTVTLAPIPINPENEPVNWDVAEVVKYFKDIGLPQYCEEVQRHHIDGAVLLDILRSPSTESAFAEFGITSTLHISKIRSRLFFAHSVAGEENQEGSNSTHSNPHSPRWSTNSTDRHRMGPLPRDKELPQKYRHLEYIGCCGFPCRRGENSNKLKIEESDSEPEPGAAKPPAGTEGDVEEGDHSVPDETPASHSRTTTVSRFGVSIKRETDDRTMHL